eukprot:4738874-Pyramimonas_sp.AAC.1
MSYVLHLSNSINNIMEGKGLMFKMKIHGTNITVGQTADTTDLYWGDAHYVELGGVSNTGPIPTNSEKRDMCVIHDIVIRKREGETSGREWGAGHRARKGEGSLGC